MEVEEEEVLSAEQKRVLRELAWRRTLTVGDRVDAIYSASSGHSRISHWAPGTITSVFNSFQDPSLINAAVNKDDGGDLKFYVRFDGQPELLGDTLFVWTSAYIAPPGTFTQDFEWRYSLKVGDMVDCIDSVGTWYRSTVLKVKEAPQVSDDIEKSGAK